MPRLLVEISRFIDEYQPGFVECRLIDADGKQHLFHEKVPMVSSESLWSTSTYPSPGTVECEVHAAWRDQDGRNLVRVSTEMPWHVESTEGTVSFVVLPSQIEGAQRELDKPAEGHK